LVVSKIKKSEKTDFGQLQQKCNIGKCSSSVRDGMCHKMEKNPLVEATGLEMKDSREAQVAGRWILWLESACICVLTLWCYSVAPNLFETLLC
jgi:hypothetical protein